MALSTGDFQAALPNVACNHSGIFVSNDRLGRWLKKVEGQIMDGLTLKREGARNGYPLWRLDVKWT